LILIFEFYFLKKHIQQTPVVLQAVENKNIIASDEFLNTLLETIKEGVLNCKIVCKDGKRSTDRSWRPAWAVLKKSGALFLCKEKKDNIMIPSTDSYPINLKNSNIDIAYDYTKRKCVFKVNTFSNSEYLFQTIDNDSMLEWIRAMQENSTPPDLNKLIEEAENKQNLKKIQLQNSNTVSMPTTPSSTSNKNWHSTSATSTNSTTIAMANNSNSSLNEHISSPLANVSNLKYFSNNNNVTNFKSMNNSPELNLNLSSTSPEDFAQQNLMNLNSGMSPGRKNDDTSPRRDGNRKWVRQMTRRIRDFMTNTNTGKNYERVY